MVELGKDYRRASLKTSQNKEREMYMPYDFTSFYDRRSEGSRKWESIDQCQECEENLIVPMTVADLDLHTAPEITNVLKKYVDKSILGYSKPTENYFQAVIDYMGKHYDYPLEEEWIVPTAGVVPALAASVRAFTEEKEGVIVFPPVYNPFYEVVENQNREIMTSPLQLKNNRYEIDFDQLENLARNEKAKLIFLCSPHNPSGRVWKKEELLRISEIAESNNLLVMSDEIHADMTLEGQKHFLYASISEKAAAHSLVFTSASKSYNLAGLQSSNVFISNSELREKFEAANSVIGLKCPNVLGLKATAAAYQKADKWFEELMVLLNNNVNLTIDMLSEADSRFKVMRPEASYLVWVNIEEFGLTNEEFVSKLEDQHIYVTDGDRYGKEGDGWIRLNVGMPTKALLANLERFKKLTF